MIRWLSGNAVPAPGRYEYKFFVDGEELLDPENPELTVEGYPAPWRVFLSAAKT